MNKNEKTTVIIYIFLSLSKGHNFWGGGITGHAMSLPSVIMSLVKQWVLSLMGCHTAHHDCLCSEKIAVCAKSRWKHGHITM